MGDDRDNYLNKIATDIAYFNTFHLNTQFNKGGEIGILKHIDTSFMRSGKMELETRKVESYYMSTRWDIATRKRQYAPDELIYKPIEIPAFDPKKMRTPLSKKNGQIIQSKSYSPGKMFYTDPPYMGALNYIDIAGKISSYHKSQLDNGMVGNIHIHMFADLSDKTKRKRILKALNEQYAGSGNAGRIFLTYSTTEAGKPTLEATPDTGAHQALATLNDKVNQEIVSAHQIPREMAGIDVKTGLGGLQIRDAVEMFQNISIQPKQKQIADTHNKILQFNGIDAEMSIDPLSPTTFLLSDDLMKLSHTVNEIREIANSPAFDDEIGDTILINMENAQTGSDISE